MALGLAEAELVSLFTETFLFGVYSVLIIVTLTIFITRRETRRVKTPLLVVTVLMYMLSMSHIILILVQDIQAFISQDAGGGHPSNFDDQNNKLLVAQEFIEVMNIISADSILIWRVWVVWGRAYWIAFFPFCTLLGTIVTALLFAHSFQTTPPGDSIFQGDVIKFAPPAAALTLVTNVMCTTLIAGRIWFMQRRIANSLPTHSTPHRRVVLLILESGFIYSAAWVSILILFGSDTYGLYIVFDMIAQLTGIVPTTIVLLSHMNLMLGSEVERKYASTLNFRARTGPGASTTLRSGVAIDTHHEYFPNNEDGQGEFPLQFRENTSTMGLGEVHGSKAEPLA